jgi:hypothetical protein
MTEYTVKVGFWVRGYDEAVIEATPETVIDKAKAKAKEIMEKVETPEIDPERRDGVIVYIDTHDRLENWGECVEFDDDSLMTQVQRGGPRMLEALKAIAEIEDPKSGDRGPIKVARHIAKAVIKEVEPSS